MTKTISTSHPTLAWSYSALLCMTLLLSQVLTAHASVVTGTLSSDTTTTTVPTGSISGTVTSDDDDNDGGSSSSGGRRRSSSSDTPTGAVLGASTDNTPVPSFPNAGFEPEGTTTDQTLWSVVASFFKGMFSF